MGKLALPQIKRAVNPTRHFLASKGAAKRVMSLSHSNWLNMPKPEPKERAIRQHDVAFMQRQLAEQRLDIAVRALPFKRFQPIDEIPISTCLCID